MSGGFAPVAGPGSRALILGSWPSPKSRAQGFYYGNAQNRFWPLLAGLAGRPAPEVGDIPAKKRLILDSGLALWDVLADCEIVGASDASIRNPVPNDFAALLATAPIEAVLCNGAAAWRLYEQFGAPQTGLHAVRLPSTSPANAAFGMVRLRAAWGEALGVYLPQAKGE